MWNIGAEGQLTLGAVASGGVALLFWGHESSFILPLMMLAGIAGGMLWAAIPAFLKAQLKVNEILTSLMLTYVAGLLLSALVYGPWKDPEGMNFPQSRMFSAWETVDPLLAGTRIHIGVPLALVVALADALLVKRTLLGFKIKVTGARPQRRALCRLPPQRHGVACLLAVRRPGRACRHARSRRSDRAACPGDHARLWLHRDHCRFLRPAQSARHRRRQACSWRCPMWAAKTRRSTVGLPRAATGMLQGLLLFFLLATDFLARYRIRSVGRGCDCRSGT